MLSLLLLSFVYAQNVEIKLDRYPFTNPYQATIASTAYSFSVEKFDKEGEEDGVEIYSDKESLPYKTWLQEKPAPLIIVLPGFGGHFRSTSTLRLAQTLFNKGYSVVSTANVFNFEFLESALTAAVPGYTPQDALDLHKALRAIINDIKAKNNDVQIQGVGLTGYSHGALLTLFLASIEETLGLDAIGIESFVAINPPIDLDYSLSFLDESYELFKSWNQKQRQIELLNFTLSAKNLADPRKEKEQTEIIRSIPSKRARVGIATSFRLSLHEIIRTSLELGNLNGLMAAGYFPDLKNIETDTSHRAELYRQIEKNYSFTRYVNEAVIPYYQSKLPEKTGANLIFDSGLRAIESTLRTNNKIKIIHNKDDILMHTPERLEWLKQAAGSKLVLFDKGGHVGNLHMPEVQNIFINSFFTHNNSLLLYRPL